MSLFCDVYILIYKLYPCASGPWNIQHGDFGGRKTTWGSMPFSSAPFFVCVNRGCFITIYSAYKNSMNVYVDNSALLKWYITAIQRTFYPLLQKNKHGSGQENLSCNYHIPLIKIQLFWVGLIKENYHLVVMRIIYNLMESWRLYSEW